MSALPPMTTKSIPKCGGYTDTSRAITKEIEDMWNAVKPDSMKSKTVKLLDYTSQVVAGTNYKIRMKVSDGVEEKTFIAVIFKPLHHTGQSPSLTSMKEQ